MKYPVILHKDAGSEYGCIVPDFPGVSSGGKTIEETIANVQAAIETYCKVKDGFDPPCHSALEAVLASRNAEGRAIVLADVNFDFLEKKAVPVTIRMPLYMRVASTQQPAEVV
jgi:Uncharacterized conserved protein